jgi:hypothetical protein
MNQIVITAIESKSRTCIDNGVPCIFWDNPEVKPFAGCGLVLKRLGLPACCTNPEGKSYLYVSSIQ